MLDARSFDFDNTPASPRRPPAPEPPPSTTAAPLVTIVTPFFDTDPEIFAQTARTVAAQSLRSFEWLIVDDGSSRTESVAALDEAVVDPRVRIVRHSANRGLSAARNTGFAAARSDYVVQLDSDDLLEPTAVERWFECLVEHPDLSFCKGFTVIFGGRERLWRGGFHHGSAFLARNQTDPTAMVRRSVHQAVGGYDSTNRDGLEDWDFWLRCADAGYWGGTIPAFLHWHRWRDESAPGPWRNWDEGPRQEAFRRRLRERYPELWSQGIPRSAGAPPTARIEQASAARASSVLRAPARSFGGRLRVYLWLAARLGPAHRRLLGRGGRAYRAFSDALLNLLIRR